MGATNSIHNGLSNHIYVSYDSKEKNNRYLSLLISKLRNKNYNIVYSDITSDSLYHLPVKDISFTMEDIMSQSLCIIICVSESTIRSFYQAIEINTALERNSRIIYLILDIYYSPYNNTIVKALVKDKPWYPLYSSYHVSDCIDILNKNTNE